MPGHDLLEKTRLLTVLNARTDLSSTDVAVAQRLLDHLNSKDGRCFPSFKKIAKGIGMSRATAMRSIKKLEKARILIVKRQTRVEGRINGWRSNYYDFDWSMAKQSPPDEKPTRTNGKSTPASATHATTPGDTPGTTPSTAHDTLISEDISHENIIHQDKDQEGRLQVQKVSAGMGKTGGNEEYVRRADSENVKRSLSDIADKLVMAAVAGEIGQQDPGVENPVDLTLRGSYAFQAMFAELLRQRIEGRLIPADVEAVARTVLENAAAVLGPMDFAAATNRMRIPRARENGQ
jgi:predicted transcriptional regulator